MLKVEQLAAVEEHSSLPCNCDGDLQRAILQLDLYIANQQLAGCCAARCLVPGDLPGGQVRSKHARHLEAMRCSILIYIQPHDAVERCKGKPVLCA